MLYLWLYSCFQEWARMIPCTAWRQRYLPESKCCREYLVFFNLKLSHYAVLWLVLTWSPYRWSLVEITPVLTTCCGYYPCVHYFYFPWHIMTSQCPMMLLGMSHCGTTMGNDVARDIHCDITMDNDIAMCT